MTIETNYTLNPDTGYFELPKGLSVFVSKDNKDRETESKKRRNSRFWKIQNRVYVQLAGQTHDNKPMFIEVLRHNHKLSNLYPLIAEQPGRGDGQLFSMRTVVYNAEEMKWQYRTNSLYNVFVIGTGKTAKAYSHTDTGKRYTETFKRDNMTIHEKSVSIVQTALLLASQQGTFNGKEFSLGKDKTPFAIRFEVDSDEGTPIEVPQETK